MRRSLFFGLIAILGLVGCSRNQEIDIPDANLSLFARTESPAESRTVVESGIHVYWEPGDEIAVFMGEKSAKFTTDITAASGTATFKGTFGDSEWPEEPDIWAVYPFSEDATFDGETITTTLPSEQIAREGSFGKDMNLSIAHSNSSTLQFYNVGGGIRFSVTEEGIKKVMFEGLSGEIISGKVKIGMDEDGKPEVREVTGGSQFITLLPPSGKETFEKDTWYYIVAIPGTLVGGYKLRFYKDSDYARKVSEKVVQIKRSIFGSLEKADSGIEYETTTTHFPETEYEWEESFAITDRVTVDVERLTSLFERGEIDVSKIAEELIKDEDIVDVAVNPEKTTVAFMQKDSIWLNVFLTTQPEIPEDFSFNSPSTNKSEIDSHKSPQIQDNKKQSTVLEEGKTALILTPFQEKWKYPIDKAETQLISAGFTSVVKKSDKDAGIEAFWGENLNGYDFIMINTHGGTSYRHKEPKGESKSFQTVFCSSTVYRSDFIRFFQDLFGDVDYDPETVAIAYESEAKKWFVCMTTDFLDKASFDNTLVLTTACESMKITDDSDGKTSMAKAFINHGAIIFAGFKETINRNVSRTMGFGIVKFMCNGFDFSTASEFWQNHEGLREASEENRHYGRDRGWSEEDLAALDPDLYDYYPPACSQYLFFDAAPFLNEVEINEGQVILSWDCRLKPFDDMFIYDLSESGYGKNSFYHTFDIAYDVHVGGSRLGKDVDPDDRDKTASCTLSPGEYTWYVVAKIMEGETVLASYQSGTGKFAIKDPEPVIPDAIDLGLPSGIKWASFNLGATKPEEFGDYFAWGETEPCYSSLDPLVWKPEKPYGYNWMHYKWAMGSETTLTKYCSDAEYGYNGFTDGKITLDPEDDAAQVNLGDKWRMPTDQEWEELTSNCSFVWTQQNGVSGFTVTSKKTGFTDKSIFLPAAGVWFWQNLNSAGSEGYYWSLTGYRDSQTCSYGFWFQSSGPGCCSLDRCYGFAIRPVYGDRKTIPSGDIEGTEEDPWN